LADGFKEVFKIKYARRIDTGGCSMISSTKSFVTPGINDSGHMVYDLDCDAIEKELAALVDHP
jgi:hypothetical protein